MRRAILLGALLVAGCGPSATSTDTAIAGAEDCGKKPAFVPLYADAKVTLCSANHDDATRRDSGMILYASAAAPAAVLAWSKAEAAKAGLAERLSTPEMFSAGEGDRRTVMVMAAAKGTGSQVTLNWGRER
jgi:hypothetical protein